MSCSKYNGTVLLQPAYRGVTGWDHLTERWLGCCDSYNGQCSASQRVAARTYTTSKVETGRVPFSTLFHPFPYQIRKQEMGFPPVFAGSRFHPELTRIWSVFRRVFNLCEICLEIDMFINLLITNYACKHVKKWHTKEYWTNNFVHVYYVVTFFMYTREYLIMLF